jgi:hypothetical protein
LNLRKHKRQCSKSCSKSQLSARTGSFDLLRSSGTGAFAARTFAAKKMVRSSQPASQPSQPATQAVRCKPANKQANECESACKLFAPAVQTFKHSESPCSPGCASSLLIPTCVTSQPRVLAPQVLTEFAVNAVCAMRAVVLLLGAVCAVAPSLLGLASAAVKSHRVTTLPGYPGPLPGIHYSGYLNVSLPDQHRIANVHYWFVENAKADPKAPTVLWLQGGPGEL